VFAAVTEQPAAKILATEHGDAHGDAHIGGNVSRGMSSRNGR